MEGERIVSKVLPTLDLTIIRIVCNDRGIWKLLRTTRKQQRKN